MSVAATELVRAYKVGKEQKAKFTLVFSGSYTSGGDTLDLRGKGGLSGNAVPNTVEIDGAAGFLYQYVKGTDLSNGKVTIRLATTSGTNIPFQEHGATTIVSGVTGDTITATVEMTYGRAK